MANDYDLKSAVILFAKIILSLFILRVLLRAVGYHGYIPVADEIFNGVMSVFYSIGGGSPSITLPNN